MRLRRALLLSITLPPWVTLNQGGTTRAYMAGSIQPINSYFHDCLMLRTPWLCSGTSRIHPARQEQALAIEASGRIGRRQTQNRVPPVSSQSFSHTSPQDHRAGVASWAQGGCPARRRMRLRNRYVPCAPKSPSLNWPGLRRGPFWCVLKPVPWGSSGATLRASPAT
jgi:hypothetical protein